MCGLGESIPVVRVRQSGNMCCLLRTLSPYTQEHVFEYSCPIPLPYGCLSKVCARMMKAAPFLTAPRTTPDSDGISAVAERELKLADGRVKARDLEQQVRTSAAAAQRVDDPARRSS